MKRGRKKKGGTDRWAAARAARAAKRAAALNGTEIPPQEFAVMYRNGGGENTLTPVTTLRFTASKAAAAFAEALKPTFPQYEFFVVQHI